MLAEMGDSTWRRVRWVLLALTLATNLALVTLFPSWISDKSIQIAAAQNLMDGNGYGIYRANPQDLSETVFRPVKRWPVGYSALLASVGTMTGNVWFAVLFWDVIGVLLLFASWFWIVEKLRLTPAAKTVLWLVMATFGTPLSSLYSGDLIALAFYSFGIATILHSLSNRSWTPLVLASLAFGVSAALRPAYWPLLLVPFLVLWNQERWKVSLRPFVTLILSLCFVLGTVLYQRANSGNATSLDNRGAGRQTAWHWKSLSRAYPFPLLAFNVDEAAFRWAKDVRALSLAKYTPESPLITKLFAWGLAFLLLAFYLQQTRLRYRAGPVADSSFILFGWLSIALTLAMLIALTLWYPPLSQAKRPGWQWVYLESKRYYAVAAPFLLVALVDFLFPKGKVAPAPWSRGALGAILAFCLVLPAQAGHSIAERLGQFSRPASWMEFVAPINGEFARAIAPVRDSEHALVYLEDVGDRSRHRSVAATLGIPFSSHRSFSEYRLPTGVQAILGVDPVLPQPRADQLKETCGRLTFLKTINFGKLNLYHCQTPAKRITQRSARPRASAL